MRKIFVMMVFVLLAFDIFSQSTNQEEDKNLELKEQSLYSEEEDQEVPMPKSFTLDPMKDEDQDNNNDDVDSNITTPQEQNQVIVEDDPDVSQQATTEPPSQEYKEEKEEIHTLAGKNHHSGGFGALSFKATNFNDKNLVMAGFRAGWIINRSIAIGIDGYGIIPTAEYSGIDPLFNTRVVGGYGGLFLEPIIFSNKIIHVTFPVSGGAGWMGYLYDWEDLGYNYGGDLVDGDVFWYIEPGAAIELNVSRNFRINFGASYRFTQDLEILNTSASAFDDWNYFLTLKFGKF